MKRTHVFALIVIMMVSVLFTTGCKKEYLTSPDEFEIDYDNQLSWDAIDYARGYEIAIKNENNEIDIQEIRKTYFSLDYLPEGDYVITVRSIGDEKKHASSDWSKETYFHKDYSSGCLYELINGKTEFQIKRVGKATGDVIIEDEFKGKPVTRIADNAFKGNTRIEGITIGSNVTEIGKNAFYNCSKLTYVILPNGLLSLGEAAFQSCKGITEFRIPDSLTEIGDYTFAYCRGIENLIFNEKIESIGESAFSDCSSLKEITLPNSVKEIKEYSFSGCAQLTDFTFGKGIETVGAHAFYKNPVLAKVDFTGSNNLKVIKGAAFSYCDVLSDINLPEGLEIIEAETFLCCKELKSLNIPSTVYRIGVSCFYESGIYNDALENGNSFIYADKWLVDVTDNMKSLLSKDVMSNKLTQAEKDALQKYTLFNSDFGKPEGAPADWERLIRNDTVGIADQTFYGCQTIKKIVVPKSIKYIGRYAFGGEKNLTIVQSQEASNLKLIDDFAFADSNVSTLSLADGIERIGSYSFYKNPLENNTNIHWIPDTVTSIGSYAFFKTSLWDNQNDSVVYADHWVVGFNGTLTSTIDLHIEGEIGDDAHVVGIADYAFFRCDDVQNITGIQHAIHVGEGAFYLARNLGGVSLNNVLTEIKDFTFYGCSSLLGIQFPMKLERIGIAAFYGCTSLSDVSIGTYTKEIDDYAFYTCRSLLKVRFGKNVERIGDRAFYDCSYLMEVELPEKLKEIGKRAFAYNTSLSTVTFGPNIESIGDSAFLGCMSLESIVLNDKKEGQIEKYVINSAAFYDCISVNKLILGKGTDIIDDYAFVDMISVLSLAIPEGVTSIGTFAFKDMKSLISLYLPSTVEEIEDHAFFGCDNLTIFYEGETLPDTFEERFNSSYRTIITGCTFDEDGYLVSIKWVKNNNKNLYALNGSINPIKDGYVCVKFVDDEDNEYLSLTDCYDLEDGTVIYAVYEEIPEVIEGEENEEND